MSNQAAEVLEKLQDGDMKEIIQSDPLILGYLALQVESLGPKQDRKENDLYRVNQKARSLARLVNEARNIRYTTVKLSDLNKPENFDTVLDSTKKLSLDKETPSPSLAKKIGNILGHIIVIKIGWGLRLQDENMQKDASDFQKLFKAEWNRRINSVATKKQIAEKRKKVVQIPHTEDF